MTPTILGRPTGWTLRAALVLTTGLLISVSVAGLALANHERPGSGTPVRVPLVPAFTKCVQSPAGGFNATHGPEGLNSCNPPVPLSPFLRMGTIGQGAGFVKLDVVCTNAQVPACPAPGDQEDVEITVSQTDVRCAVAGYNCAAANDDYDGPVMVRLPIRLTDHYNGPNGPIPPPCPNVNGAPPCVTATVEDIPLSIQVPCVVSGPPTPPGSQCNLSTTIDAVVPLTLITENQRGVYQMYDQVDVLDPGADKSFANVQCPYVCGTGDENTFVTQGWFAP